MIDADGYRPNVGIVVANALGQVLWARRVGGHDAWQFPQGGVQDNEKPEQALFRELQEEIGLREEHVRVLGCTDRWLRYQLPQHMRRDQRRSANRPSNRVTRRRGKERGGPVAFKGQKQKWFLLEMLASDDEVRFDLSQKPEFDAFQWVSYWYPVNKVIEFKRDVYRRALKQLAPRLPVDQALLLDSQASLQATQGAQIRESGVDILSDTPADPGGG